MLSLEETAEKLWAWKPEQGAKAFIQDMDGGLDVDSTVYTLNLLYGFLVVVYTAGASGNEEVVKRANWIGIFWKENWLASIRGGWYLFWIKRGDWDGAAEV